MPSPKARPATKNVKSGIKSQETWTVIGLPFNLNIKIATRRRQNCMRKRIKFDSTTDNGIINLGKYTFPKIAALFTNVFDVLVRHTEK
jgi:hypothetical protein